MKKIFSIIAMCFMLQGCFYQTTNQFDIYRASTFCGNSENIAEINIEATGGGSVVCYDGRSTRLRLINPPMKVKQ